MKRIEPIVSICCTAYNHEKYIRQSIEGFLSQQTDFPIEVIIHDDASDDGTPRIIKEYYTERPDIIVPILQEKNQYSKGKKPLVDYAFKRAHGKYIALCEGDDYWADKLKLQKQVDFMELNPSFVMCYHDAMIIDEHGRTLKHSKLPDNLKRDFSQHELIQGAMVLTLTICFRNLIKTFPLELYKVHNGDKFLTSLLGHFGKGKYLNNIESAVYRKHSRAVWSKLDKAHQIFYNGDTRAWLYRYYKRIGKHKYAGFFKEDVFQHFRKVIEIIDLKKEEHYSNILHKIFTQYPDIGKAGYEDELKKLIKFKFNNDFSKKIDHNRRRFSQSKTTPGKRDYLEEKCRVKEEEIENNESAINDFFIKLDQKGWSHKKKSYKKLLQYIDFRKEINFPAISVIVISWRLHHDTLKNFTILEKQRKHNFVLIFVDNGGKTGEFDKLQPYIDTYVKLRENSGAYLARNIGAVFAKAPILLFLEDDGIPEDNLVAAHLELFAEYDIIACRGVYSPKTNNPLNSRQGHYYVGDKEYPTFAHVEGNTSYLTEPFFKVGGWDDEIRFGGGGLELYFRLLSVEPDIRKQIYSPRPIIYHDYAQSEEHLSGKLEKQKESFKRLRHKYPEWDQVHNNYRKLCGRSDLLIKRGAVNESVSKTVGSNVKRVLFVNHSVAPYETSGTPISTWNHCLGMKALGKEVGVLFPSPEVNERFRKETISGVSVYKVPRLDKYQIFIGNIQSNRLNAYLEWVQEVIRDFRPDLVHINDYVYMPANVVRLFHEAGCIVVRNVCNDEEICHWDYPVIGMGIDSRLCSGPESSEKCSDCFMTSRVKDNSAAVRQMVHEGIKKNRQYISELYQSAVDGIIFTDVHFKEHFKKFIPLSEEKTRVVPRGFQFDFDRVVVARSARPTVRFAFIGNIMFSKGIDVALRAFETLSSSGRFELHIYGQMVNSEFEKWMDKLRSEHPKQFHYHGPYRKDELSAIARDIDVAIVPSYFDTYNRVVREMLYCGVPVIATNFFGASIINDGYNGLKAPVGDYRALARCIERILDHPELVAKLSEGATQTVIPGLSDEIEKIDKFYDWLAEKRKNMKAESKREQSTQTYNPLVKAIAFYLPQYHPIPENDRWWGKGFTEWTNITKAKPLFSSHYQPHLPKDLGFYDLRLPEVREEQAQLAREYGIHGFCYYHYWFNGKRLLNRPLDEILSTKNPDFPFCLCWANEHWTRAWDGHQGEILMHQEFSEEDDRNHIQWLLKVFQDKRYIRINEKPLMIVYLSTRLPNASRTAEIWRTEAEKAGEELYLCKVESAPYEYGDPRLIGFDACIEFQPDWGNLGPYERSIENGHVVFNYEAVVNRMLNKEIVKYKRYPCVTPMWDNSPRRQQSAVIFDNSSPAVYAKWLGSIANNIAKYNLDDSIVFINAWNEWGEGNHLEPDLKHERKYLEATKQALQGAHSSDARLHEGLVSIVILTCNQIRYTKECFESIQKYTREPYEIIFVDNGSTDGTTQWLQEIVQTNHRCRLIQNPANLGFSTGSNQGIQTAIGEYVLLLNNDVVVTENWLGGLLECFDREDRIGIVGPMTNHISGPQKVPQVDYASVADLHGYARSFRNKNRYRRILNRRVVGFCMLFKRRLVDEIGLLDESFGSGNFEDDDLCLRACLAGYRNLIAGDVFIHHYGSRTFVGNKINYGSSLSRNRKVFQDKWRQPDILKRFGKRLIVQNGIFHAEEYFRKDELEKATASILDAIKQAPDERQLYIQLAQMLIEKKRFDDALGILASLPEKKADSTQYALMGYCHEALGNDRSAEDDADQALALQPASALALNVKGVLAFKRNDRAAAEAWFRSAIESDPCFGESYTNLGSLKWEAGEQDEALEAFQRGFILSPTIEDVATAYHTAIVATKSFDNAERVFREARALHPTYKRLAFLMIAVLLQQEKHEPAMSEIEKAILQFGIDDGILSAGLEVRKRIGALKNDKSKSKKATLSVCMIVKNEEAHLAKCLMSVKPVVDEMIVVDTGSSDRSKDIAAALGARVFEYPWTNDFSEARNYSLAQASGDWILVLDADEVISTLDHGLLQKITKKRPAKHRAYIMVTRNYTNNPGSKGWAANEGRYIEEEAGAGWVPSPKVRLFVNDRRIRFVNPVHELVEPTLAKLGIPIRTCDVPVHHYGRLNRDKLMAKGKEYFRLGIAKIEQTQGDYNALRELAIQASEIGEYEEAVGVWQKVIERQPNDAVAYMNLGFAFLMMRQYVSAAEFSKKAMAVDPELREAALNYAAAEMFAGDIRTAISTLEHLLEKHADYPPAMGRLAAAYIVSGRKIEGLRYLEKLDSRGFDCAGAWEEQARAFISESKHEAAALLLAAAIEKGLGNGRMSQLMAECRSRIDGGVKLAGPAHASHGSMQDPREPISMNAGV